jgi:hypothetical protein
VQKRPTRCGGSTENFTPDDINHPKTRNFNLCELMSPAALVFYSLLRPIRNSVNGREKHKMVKRLRSIGKEAKSKPGVTEARFSTAFSLSTSRHFDKQQSHLHKNLSKQL